MFDKKLETGKIMKLGEAAKYVAQTPHTLQEWDRSGKLEAHRDKISNRRFYYQGELDYILGKETSKNEKRKTVAYARVSSRSQKSDLKNQVDFLREYLNANGIIADKYMSDIGSGLNYKRPKWLRLLKAVDENKIGKIYVTYEDRFVRFGFDFFKKFCDWHGCEIVVLNNQNTSPIKELINDLLSIIQDFSVRLSGLKKYKKEIKNDESLMQKDSDDAK